MNNWERLKNLTKEELQPDNVAFLFGKETNILLHFAN